MPTSPLFRDDPYLQSCSAKIVGMNERGGIILDQTAFYATGGGQPGDQGQLEFSDGRVVDVATTVYEADKATIVHVPATPLDADAVLRGESVTARIDWPRRYDLMRTHTCLHLLCSLISAPVTGGSVDVGKGRLDFDIPDTSLDKDQLTAELQCLIDDDREVSSRWIDEAELDANPGLVRTMSVQPPRGSGRIRLIEIYDCDLQPCGGTHVASTGEIVAARVTKIEKKGAMNRRVRVELGGRDG